MRRMVRSKLPFLSTITFLILGRICSIASVYRRSPVTCAALEYSASSCVKRAASPAAPLITVLDVNAAPSGGPFAEIQAGFIASQAQLLAFYESPAGGGLSPAAAEQLVVQGYHTNVAPFCAVAARSFFNNFLGG